MRVTIGINKVSIPKCVDLDSEISPATVTLKREIDDLSMEATDVEVEYIPCQNIVTVTFTIGKLPTGRYKFLFNGKFKYSSLCWIQ